MASRNLVPVVPFDDPLIIAGQGTIALEILAELPDTDVLMIQLSGGGLLAGMAMAAKSINPNIHVVGISLERSPAMLESLKTGRPVQVEEKDTLADSLLGGIGFNNQYTLPMVENFVDEHLLVMDRANMNYLTGYDGWSFYVHQGVIVSLDAPYPFWFGREQDSNGARLTSWKR